MVIGIQVDGRIFFRSDRVSIDELPARIRGSVSQGSEKKVYIKADARAKYGWVAEVLDNVRSAGVEKIAFLVDQRQAPAPKSPIVRQQRPVAPCYNLSSPERLHVEADPVISSAGGSKIPRISAKSSSL